MVPPFLSCDDTALYNKEEEEAGGQSEQPVAPQRKAAREEQYKILSDSV